MTREKLTRILSLIGIAVAVLSALEAHLTWLAELCGIFGDGCRDAQDFAMFNIPIAWFGIAFYASVAGAAFFRPHLVSWLLAAGLGFEVLLVKIMVDQQFFCVFCTLNLIVLLMLCAAALRIKTVWQTTATALASLVAFSFFIGQGTPGPNTAQASSETDKKIAAIVAGEPIYHADIETRIAGRLYALKKDIFYLKRGQLEARIQNRILALEAEKKGLSVEKLTTDIYAGVPKVTQTEVNDYYQKNRSALSKSKEDPQVLLNKVISYLDSQKKANVMQDYILPLMNVYEVQDLYGPPELPAANVAVHNSFSIGPENAAVTIVEFSDYLCPVCRKAHHTSREIREKYKGKIRWIFKDYPLQRHKGAKYLAMAARCAGEQGKFWEFQDLLFDSEKKDMGRQDVLDMAKSLGLDMQQFTQSLDANKFLADIEQDLEDVHKAGVNATPTLIINGRLHPGSMSVEDFSKMIDEQLAAGLKHAGNNTGRSAHIEQPYGSHKKQAFF